MKEAYKEKCFAEWTVHIQYWHKSFFDDYQETGMLLRSGTLKSSITEISINIVAATIEENRHYSIGKWKLCWIYQKISILKFPNNELF